VPEEELNLLQFASGDAAEPSAGPAQVVRCELLTPIFAANSLTTCHTSFSVTPSPQGLPALLTRRKTFPVSTPAAIVHALSWLRPSPKQEPSGACLPAQIHNRTMSFALLQMIDRQLGHVVTSKSAGKPEAE
jgi:hypothetical protein